MKRMKVRIKRLRPDAAIPKKAHDTDAGLDLAAAEGAAIPARGRALIGTGIAIDLPGDTVGLVTGRSGNTIRRGLVGQLGIIDAGYHGEIGVMAFNMTDEEIAIEKGERVGQLVIVHLPPIELDEATPFGESDRGQGGFGSTGV